MNQLTRFLSAMTTLIRLESQDLKARLQRFIFGLFLLGAGLSLLIWGGLFLSYGTYLGLRPGLGTAAALAVAGIAAGLAAIVLATVLRRWFR